MKGRKMERYCISWWNVENLFDAEDYSARPKWLKKELKSELKGWNNEILERKLQQLKSIIIKMNNGNGPDILGLCEVENKHILQMLVSLLCVPGRDYQIAYHSTKDKRGIDIAFIYDENRLRAENQFSYVVLKRGSTRDILQVNFKTNNDNLLILIGNHWPSRIGGKYFTEPYRIIAAETLAYWNKRIAEICGAGAAVIIAGDFNDQPFDRSIKEYALAINVKEKVIYARIPRFYNLMYEFLGTGIGTFYYNYFPYLFDQFWVSKEILRKGTLFKLEHGNTNDVSVTVNIYDEMNSHGRYPDPIRFGRPSKGLNLNGYSDHYPISMIIYEG